MQIVVVQVSTKMSNPLSFKVRTWLLVHQEKGMEYLCTRLPSKDRDAHLAQEPGLSHCP